MNQIKNSVLNNVTFDHLKQCMKTTAELELLLNDDASLRCYSYYAAWGEDIELAKYDNGSGDDLIILFYKNNVLIKGFDHESEVSPYAQKEFGIWPGIYEGIPKELLNLVEDKALMKDHVTFCYWLLDGEKDWHQGNVHFSNDEDDGSDWLLDMIQFNSFQFNDWAEDYYEEDAKQLSDSKVEQAYKEHINKAYQSVYYCTYENDESIESNHPIKVNASEVSRISQNVVSGIKNFIGFVDVDETAIQFYSGENSMIDIDLPVADKQGSYVGEVSYSEFLNLVEQLEQPFIDYIESFNLEFELW